MGIHHGKNGKTFGDKVGEWFSNALFTLALTIAVAGALTIVCLPFYIVAHFIIKFW